MPQVVMFIDAVSIRQRGMHAPKKNRNVRAWRKDVLAGFAKDLAEHGVVGLNADTPLLKESVDETFIRFNYLRDGKIIGFLVDRQALWA